MSSVIFLVSLVWSWSSFTRKRMSSSPMPDSFRNFVVVGGLGERLLLLVLEGLLDLGVGHLHAALLGLLLHPLGLDQELHHLVAQALVLLLALLLSWASDCLDAPWACGCFFRAAMHSV